MSYDIKKIHILVQLEVEMTRKDYVAIAEAIALTIESHDDVAVHAVADAIADVFYADNSRFNRGKFMEACGF
jgi:hypothetical protein